MYQQHSFLAETKKQHDEDEQKMATRVQTTQCQLQTLRRRWVKRKLKFEIKRNVLHTFAQRIKCMISLMLCSSRQKHSELNKIHIFG